MQLFPVHRELFLCSHEKVPIALVGPAGRMHPREGTPESIGHSFLLILVGLSRDPKKHTVHIIGNAAGTTTVVVSVVVVLDPVVIVVRFLGVLPAGFVDTIADATRQRSDR